MTIPDELKIVSEAIEPAFAHLIGHWWAQADHAKQTYGARSVEHVGALENLWLGAGAINRVTSCAPEAVHANLTANTNVYRIGHLLHQELGVNPAELDDALPLWGQIP